MIHRGDPIVSRKGSIARHLQGGIQAAHRQQRLVATLRAKCAQQRLTDLAAQDKFPPAARFAVDQPHREQIDKSGSHGPQAGQGGKRQWPIGRQHEAGPTRLVKGIRGRHAPRRRHIAAAHPVPPAPDRITLWLRSSSRRRRRAPSARRGTHARLPGRHPAPRFHRRHGSWTNDVR